MRPYYVLLVAVAILLASTNAVVISARTTAQSLDTLRGKGPIRRLRAELTNPDTDDERMLTTFKIWWAKFLATINKTKLTKKHEAMLNSWIRNPEMTPTDAYKALKLDKLGVRAQESPNFNVYKKYSDQLVERWVNFDARPETVYKALKLDQVADASSPSFAVYGTYLKAIHAKQPSKALKAFTENSDMTPTYAYKILGLDKLGRESPYFTLYQKYTDQLVKNWINFDAKPTTVYKSLKLDKNADPTSPSFAVYEQFLKARFT